MAKLLRKFQKIFSVNDPTKIGVIGSLAAGSPASSTDPDVIQSLSNYLDGWLGCVVGENSPAIQDANGLDYLETRQLAYLFQAGIAEWDVDTTYFIGSFASDGLGGYYQSLTDDNTGNALSDVANWVQSTGPQRVGDFLVTGTGRATTFEAGTGGFNVPDAAGIAYAGVRFGSQLLNRFRRANGVLATPTTVAVGNALAGESVQGYDGVSYHDSFFERVVVSAAPAVGKVPGKKEFYAARSSDGTLVLAATMTQRGLILADNATTDTDYGTITSVEAGKYYVGNFDYRFAANSGFAANQDVNFRYTRVGQQVTLTISALTAAGDATGQAAITGSSAPVPINLRPFNGVAAPVQVINNGLRQTGLLSISSAGIVSIFADTNEVNTFTASQPIGWPRELTITYWVA